MLPQRLVGIKLSLRQYFPNPSMDNKNVQSRSDELQRKHDKIKERMKHSCVQPCAICCLFLPGQNYINQQKKKEDDKNWNSFFNKKLLFYLLSSFLSKWHYERSTLILQILCFFLNHHPVWPPGYTTPDCHMGLSPALTHINIGY